MNRRNFLLSTGLGAIGTSWLAAQRLRNGASHVAQRQSSTPAPKDVRELAVTKHDVGWPQRLGPDGHCVARETGLMDSFPDAGPARLWQHEIGTGYSSPIVRSMTPKPLLKGPTYASPALCEGRLFVRNEYQLVCFDLRG